MPAMQAMTLEEFNQVGDQGEEFWNSSSRPIPALLSSNETLQEYEQSFKWWLDKRDVTPNDPSIERQLWLDFAVLRAWELQRSDGFERRQYYRMRSREELLATCIQSTDEFLRSMEFYGPNGDMYFATKKLKRIAIVLKPHESPAEFEVNFKKWLNAKHVTLSMLRDDPEEERRFRQCYAYARKLEDQVLDRLQEVEHQVKILRDSAGDNAGVNEPPTASLEKPGMLGNTGMLEPGEIPSSSSQQHQCMIANESTSTEVNDRATTSEELEDGECNLEPEERLFPAGPDAGEILIKAEKGVEPSRNAATFAAAEEAFAESVRVNDNTEKKHLIEDYTRLNDQISTNETAIQDTLSYVNLTADIDKASTTEHLSQIKELMVSINKEKRRRDSVLAAVIAHDWIGRQEELDILVQDNTQTQTLSPSHEQMMVMYGKLEQKGNNVATLRSKLQSQLDWLNAEDTGRDDKFHELEELVEQLKAELDALSELESQRQRACVRFLKSDKSIHKMVLQLLQ
ncbi:hypothetical protein PHYBOEH_004712 [Phytophthora boehmeriae]|uniref:Uncharacterized protein n=1 Tax=Phytophthora boehmeriae TaxID=109152 RepID=A0A8T1WQW5_9STRA|nr:hypothetical protein PHYBOEH_004712 [Phytophthora boehmeriae]